MKKDPHPKYQPIIFHDVTCNKSFLSSSTLTPKETMKYDSADLPLNVSREILQSTPMVDSIRAALTKRVLDMLGKLANNEPEKYATFWTQFGAVLKEGPSEDHSLRLF